MNKEIMLPTELSIKDRKNMVKGNVNRTALFARTKVIDVITADNERFYLIYYKNSLIYGDKLDKVEEESFINKHFVKVLLLKPLIQY
ncbi:hypothetical protein SAMN05444673_3131 [Bacillus sp. OV166]|uniref:hypothetical protein n=1 Tax=Bacillus sp. OV166 TaxID=1882763 RepID=UPI000A2ACC5F|nr:hypothetical protein [Bacillus sp. OV166]SMQ77902.1 hypothetical protein SAMN05444673_3131 [Bacillus sp. OV166]